MKKLTLSHKSKNPKNVSNMQIDGYPLFAYACFKKNVQMCAWERKARLNRKKGERDVKENTKGKGDHTHGRDVVPETLKLVERWWS